MIKNQKQAALARKEIENLRKILSEANLSTSNFAERLQNSVYEGQLNDLLSELEEYERLTSNDLDSLELKTEDLPKSIISFRIASGLTQKDLAEKLEIQEQQIQRYEQTDYLTASFERIIQILRVLEVEVSLKKKFKRTSKIKYLNPTISAQQTTGSATQVRAQEPEAPYTAGASSKDEASDKAD